MSESPAPPLPARSGILWLQLGHQITLRGGLSGYSGRLLSPLEAELDSSVLLHPDPTTSRQP